MKGADAMSQVVVFLMVLFISQTFRHERIMELAQQVADADLERARQDAGLAQVSSGVMVQILPVAAAALHLHLPRHDAVTCLCRRAFRVDIGDGRMVRPQACAAAHAGTSGS